MPMNLNWCNLSQSRALKVFDWKIWKKILFTLNNCNDFFQNSQFVRDNLKSDMHFEQNRKIHSNKLFLTKNVQFIRRYHIFYMFVISENYLIITFSDSTKKFWI